MRTYKATFTRTVEQVCEVTFQTWDGAHAEQMALDILEEDQALTWEANGVVIDERWEVQG